MLMQHMVVVPIIIFFVHKGVHHVLKLMPQSAIKAVIFPHVKVKKKVAEIVPKSRTTLLQGTENDVNIPTLAAASESVIHDNSAKKISDINPQFNESSDIAIMGNSSVIINYLGESCDANKSPIQFGSFCNFVGHHSKKDENIIDTKMKKPVELMPKPRTALFQGGGRATLGSTRPSGPKTGVAASRQILVVMLFRLYPSTPSVF